MIAVTIQRRRTAGLLIGIAIFYLASPGTTQARDPESPERQEVVEAMHRAVQFFRTHASASGGYVYQLSHDLSKREGEGKVGDTTAWIQPPGTPSVGMAYLDAYRLCRDPILLDAAKETAEALRQGQLESGGWDNRIEFSPEDRRRYAYRVDQPPQPSRKLRNVSTLDDNKTQSVIRFLIQLDQELDGKDRTLRGVLRDALDAVVAVQYPNGAWPQRFEGRPDPAEYPILKASIPDQWPKTFPGNKYAAYYTLNDNSICDVIETLLDAWQWLDDPRYLQAALRGGDFLLLAQLPEPQPGWAQQYNREMHPAWARKFEPPAITGGESQRVIRTLMTLYRRTSAADENAKRFLKPLPRAIEYYRSSQLADGRLARFYELGSNRPLFFTKDYRLTYSPDDMPTHYSFLVNSKLDQLEQELTRLQAGTPDASTRARLEASPRLDAKLNQKTRAILGQLDERGAWVEDGSLSYHGDQDPTRRVIRSATFIKNLQVLARWIAAEAATEPAE